MKGNGAADQRSTFGVDMSTGDYPVGTADHIVRRKMPGVDPEVQRDADEMRRDPESYFRRKGEAALKDAREQVEARSADVVRAPKSKFGRLLAAVRRNFSQ
jgi:hypothetical protein